MTTFNIEFGALVPRLADQLKDAGYEVGNSNAISAYQRDADAITRLAVRGLLTESAVRSARKKLARRISSYLALRIREQEVEHGE